MAAFESGGPTGDLIEDLATIATGVLRARREDAEEFALGRQVMMANPRLIALAHQRFQQMVDSCEASVRRRLGPEFDRHRLDVALAVVLACFHVALERFLDRQDDGPGTRAPDGRGADEDVAALFLDSLATARDLLA